MILIQRSNVGAVSLFRPDNGAAVGSVCIALIGSAGNRARALFR